MNKKSQLKDNPAPKKPLGIEELASQGPKFMEALRHEVPLACVLISTSFLEQSLAMLIHRFTIHGTTSNELCSYSGGIAPDLAKKAKMAYCLGLIPKGIFTNLILIGDVRNRFAHSHFEIDFTDKVVCDKCQAMLKYSSEECKGKYKYQWLDDQMFQIADDPRSRFVNIVLGTLAHLLELSRGVRRRTIPVDGWVVPF